MQRLLTSSLRLLLATLTFAASAAPGIARAQPCPDGNRGGYGPFDYTQRQTLAENLDLVERAHFTPEVESLLRGKSSYLGNDIDYTLRAWPNHVRALDAMSRQHTDKPRGARCSPVGYFERALRFKPDDAGVRMVYGMHFYRAKNLDKALEQLKLAEETEPKNMNVLYNLGLVYAELKKWDEARDAAIRAYRLGFPLEGLRNRLVKAGKWDGKVPGVTADAATASPAKAAAEAPSPAGAPAAESPPAPGK